MSVFREDNKVDSYCIMKSFVADKKNRRSRVESP